MSNEEMVRLYENGVSMREISSRVGRSVQYVKTRLVSAGCQIRTKSEAMALSNSQRDWSSYPTQSKKSVVKRCKDGRLDFVRNYRVQKGCEDCGATHTAILDLHHIDKETKSKKLKATGWRSMSMKSILEEIKKCIVLCSNCHRIREWAARQ